VNTRENKMIYQPRNWIVVEITSAQGDKIRKVLATWGISQWKLNSGNESQEQLEDRWLFFGYSGSTYVCYKDRYGMNSYMQGIYNNFEHQLKLGGGSIKIMEGYSV